MEDTLMPDIITFLNYPHEAKEDFFNNNINYIEGIKKAVVYVFEGENVDITEDEIDYDPRLQEIEIEPKDETAIYDVIKMLEMFDVDFNTCGGNNVRFKMSEIYKKIC